MDDKTNPKRGKRRGPKTDGTDAQQKPWLFKPGQSGNPAGRPKGSRNKLAEDFIADAYAHWQQRGSTALETMAKTEPAKFCQMMANLLPKETLMQDERVPALRGPRAGRPSRLPIRRSIPCSAASWCSSSPGRTHVPGGRCRASAT
jgi:hypothetical protein